MVINKVCPFCETTNLKPRLIRQCELYLSVVSDPSFRHGQCLVIPRRHITRTDELTPKEGAAIMQELGRLSSLLDTGYGTGIMQKYQPTQTENGTKVSHLHFHVFPRFEHETGLFPVPEPNGFDGFSKLPDVETMKWLDQLRA